MQSTFPEAAEADFIIFSDVHLGADLVQHARPWTLSKLREVKRIDNDLSTMLDHYRENTTPGRKWRLVIAGDLVDFIGMSIAPLVAGSMATPLTDEEHTHGLGSAQDHAAEKMRAVAKRHDLVFLKLAEFIADGHSLVLIRGNHDVEFYWDTAKEAFANAIMERCECIAGDPAATAAFRARIEFTPWFYYVEGLLYVEHGHQYDETCSYEHILAPVSPTDGRRIHWSISDVLLRYVVRPTPGFGSEGHDNRAMSHYVQVGLSMGVTGCARLGYRFLSAIGHLYAIWSAQFHRGASWVRAEQERRMNKLAKRFRIGGKKLRELSALSAMPVTGGFFAIMKAVFLDGILGVVFGALSILALAVSGVVPWYALLAIAIAEAAGIYAWAKSSKVHDAVSAVRRGAMRVAQLLPTPFIVMGHTHAPTFEPVADGITYVNLGSWAHDDLDGPVADAARTHLVIRVIDGRPHATLLEWDPETRACRVPINPRTVG